MAHRFCHNQRGSWRPCARPRFVCPLVFLGESLRGGLTRFLRRLPVGRSQYLQARTIECTFAGAGPAPWTWLQTSSAASRESRGPCWLFLVIVEVCRRTPGWHIEIQNAAPSRAYLRLDRSRCERP